MGCIYKITNTVNGKSYIGRTIHDAEKTRIRDHLNGKGNEEVKKDIEKYGKDAFTYPRLPSLKLPRFSGEIQTRPCELDQSVFLKKHLTFFVNCGLIFLHGGGGFDLSLESATAPVRSGLTL